MHTRLLSLHGVAALALALSPLTGCSADSPEAPPVASENATSQAGASPAAGSEAPGGAGAVGAGANAGAASATGTATGAAAAPGAAAAAAAAGTAPAAAGNTGTGAAAAGAAAAAAPGAAVAGAVAAPMMAPAGAAAAAGAAGAGGVATTAAVAAAGAGAIPLVSGAAAQGVRAAASMAAPPPTVTFAGAKSAESLMSRGNEALGAGNHSGALDLFRKAAEAGPGLAGPLFGIAASLVGLGKNAAALGALSKLSGLGTKASMAKLALAAVSPLFNALRSDPESKEEFERLTQPARTAAGAATAPLFVPAPKADASGHEHYKATIASLDTFLSDPSESTCVSLNRKGVMSEDGSKVPSTSLLIMDCKTNKKLGSRSVLSARTYGKLTKDGNTAAAIHGELSKTEDWLVSMNMTEWAPVNAEGRAKIQERIKSSGVDALPQGELARVRASLSGRRLASRDAKGKWRVFAADIEAEAKRVEAKKSCADTRKTCIKACWTECQKTMQCAQVMKCEGGCRKAQKECEAAL